jgi:RimJ/RimL family protein N-acetyltransferase
MIQLDSIQYGRVRPLFDRLDFNLVVDSILEGHTNGQVYADSARRPRVVLIWNQLDTVLLAGKPDDTAVNHALRWLFRSTLIPGAKERGVPGFALYTDPAGWEAKLPTLIPHLKSQRLLRRAFTYRGPAYRQRDALPAGMSVRPLTPALWQDPALDAAEAAGWVHSFWPTPDDFVREGIGYAVVDEAAGVVASWCLSVYAAGEARELGVATAVSHRGQGLATIAAAAALEAVRERGYVPHWHCNVDNTPSLRVAEKIGFVPERDYTITWLPFA